jgi:F-type H+-transporting ATPase subunit a
MGHPLWVTVVMNKLFGGAALALLHALRVEPVSTVYPIPSEVCMEFFVFILAIIFFLWLKPRIRADRPGAMQQVMEMLLTNPMGLGVRDLIDDNIGPEGYKYIPMIGAVGIWVLLCNMIGVVPTLESPTRWVSVPLGCAVIVFIYYNYCGIAAHGPLEHAKHFLGPNLGIAILWFPVEVISNLARLLSLTVRLWANMLASELLYGIFLGLTLALLLFARQFNAAGYVLGFLPIIAPLCLIALHLFEAILQAFVFVILPVVYVAGVVTEQH